MSKEEVKGFDVDEFYVEEESEMTETEQTIEQPQPETTPEATPETVSEQPQVEPEKPAEAVKTVEAKPVEAKVATAEPGTGGKSSLADLLKQEGIVEDKDDAPTNVKEQLVPAYVVQQLRAERRQLREENAALKQQQQQKPAEDANLPDVDDEDYITGAQLKQILAAQQQAIARKIENDRAKAQIEDVARKSIVSEAEFKKQTADYDVVTTTVNSLNLITQAERKTILFSSNPAKTYYDICQQKLNSIKTVLGVQTQSKPPVNNVNKKDVVQKQPAVIDENETSDEDVFESLFGK